MKKKAGKLILEIITLLLSLVVLMPFYLILISSIKTKAEAAELSLAIPGKINIAANYSEIIFHSNLFNGYKNSILYALIGTLLAVFCASAAAFVLQRRAHRVSDRIYSLFMSGMVLPAFIVPQVILVKKLYINALIGNVLISVAGMLPLGIFLYYGYYKSISRELDESAFIDGCNVFKLFTGIIFPLVQPLTVTYIIILVLTFWNDFNTIYLLSGAKNQTLVLIMYFFIGPHGSDWNLVFACVVLATLPVVLFYLFLQGYVVSGLTAGAVKG